MTDVTHEAHEAVVVPHPGTSRGEELDLLDAWWRAANYLA
ncbi:MAG: hypothetical protein QOK35_365, partial [Pseudonocardiales bacterium]|nr:hypothetical protein [Pseudonocardiales bacterium]